MSADRREAQDAREEVSRLISEASHLGLTKEQAAKLAAWPGRGAWSRRTGRATMSDEQEWARLADAATPGPWTTLGVRADGAFPVLAEEGRVWIAPIGSGRSADAQFIAASREAIPALLAEVAATASSCRLSGRCWCFGVPGGDRMSTEGCPQNVHRGDVWHGSYGPCGKPIKRDGLCGVHARSRDLKEAREQRWAAENAEWKAAASLAQQLTERYGIGFGYTQGNVTLTIAHAESLLAAAGVSGSPTGDGEQR